MQLRLSYSGAFAALMLAVMLCGCANPEVFESSERWFSKPFDLTGRKGGYTFSELQENKKKLGPVTANDLVSANGYCAPPPLSAVPAPVPSAASGPVALPSAAQTADAMPPAPEAPSLLGGGIALGMTECDVVYRAGTPSSVQIGQKPDGARTAVLTVDGGPRAGIYRFDRGRLTEMDDLPGEASQPRMVKRLRKRRVAPEEQISTE